MKTHALLLFAGPLWLLVGGARADEFVYLRKTTTSTQFPRYEVMNFRPSVPSENIIKVPAKDVKGLDQLATGKRDLPNHYVAPVPFSGRWPQFEVHRLEPGVSYMQSIGGGGGVPLARELAPRQAAPSPVAKANVAPSQPRQAPNAASPRNTTATVSRRPFGWPVYDNPLERRAVGKWQQLGNPLDGRR